MPSQLAHFIFALETLKPYLDLSQQVIDLSQGKPISDFDKQAIICINHGAQMPDMFYHNRRTKPSGLYISVALHRRGFAQVSKHLLASTDNKLSLSTLFALAFLSHGILDRSLHPWINYCSGWVVPGRQESDAWRHLHVACERLIDNYSSSWKNLQFLNTGFFPNIYSPDLNKDCSAIFVRALKHVYPRCKDDPDFDERFYNAKADASGFYQWSMGLSDTEYANIARRTQAYLKLRKQAGIETAEDEDTLQYIALLHPRKLKGIDPCEARIMDKLRNADHKEWTDPCHNSISRTDSLENLWTEALLISQTLANEYLNDTNWQDIVDQHLHDGDLRSHYQTGSCQLDACKPIDWIDLLYENFPEKK